jgi:hypothetical protein
MASPLDKQSHDMAVIFVPPANATDLRAPTAEEATLNSQVLTDQIVRSRRELGWLKVPSFSFSQTRRLSIANGHAILPVYPGILELNTSVSLPSLPDTTSVLSQNQRLSLVAFHAEVGMSQDAVLGQMSWDYVIRQTNQITPVVKENTRRLRAFWLIVWSASTITAADFVNLLTSTLTGRSLSLTDTSDLGFSLGPTRIYARDPNLTIASYRIFPDSVQVMELCQVRRMQNHTNEGYTWGHQGEGVLDPAFHLFTTSPRVATIDAEAAMRLRLRQLFSGQPGLDGNYNRSVQNLLASSVGNNPGFPGKAAASLNGSTCLANSQRVTFTNQAIVDRLGCQSVQVARTAENDPIITLTVASSGAVFSGDRRDHRIYDANGIEQSERGTFVGLGTGQLIWIGDSTDSNSSLSSGNIAYVNFGISYPAGSGFSIPFDVIERVWRNGIELPSGTIRVAYKDDLDGYLEPTGGSNFIVVTGRERAAIHYILKKCSLQASSTGVLKFPNDELGCLAFVQGVAGRINAPVKTGLTPNATYNALVYYPPRVSEVWQFLARYTEYQGSGNTEATFLADATIISRPLLFLHTQGSGAAVHQGEAETRYSPIALHLPAVENPTIPAYRFNARVQLAGEPRQGPITLREIIPLPAAGLCLPSPGQTLSLETATASHSRSLKGKLLVNGQVVGFRVPQLAGKAEFQAVLSFVVEKAGERRLVVATRNTVGLENCPLNSDQQTAIDIFRL